MIPSQISFSAQLQYTKTPQTIMASFTILQINVLERILAPDLSDHQIVLEEESWAAGSHLVEEGTENLEGDLREEGRVDRLGVGKAFRLEGEAYRRERVALAFRVHLELCHLLGLVLDFLMERVRTRNHALRK